MNNQETNEGCNLNGWWLKVSLVADRSWDFQLSIHGLHIHQVLDDYKNTMDSGHQSGFGIGQKKWQIPVWKNSLSFLLIFAHL